MPETQNSTFPVLTRKKEKKTVKKRNLVLVNLHENWRRSEKREKRIKDSF